jgi:HlyD family secretion protein
MSVRLRRMVFWGSLAALGAVGLAAAFWPRAVVVDSIEAAYGELAVTVDEEGEARVHDVYVLSSPVTGRTRRMDLHAGDPVVSQDTVVVEVEPIDPAFLDPRGEAQARAAVRAAEAAEALARAEVEEAEAELTFARREFDRARELIQDATISQRALDDAERAYRTRRAALTTALAAQEVRVFELERTRAALVSPSETQARPEDCACIALRSPVDGRVLRVLQQSAAVVSAGTPLAEVGDPRALEIVADLLSPDAVRISPGQAVIIENWGGERPLAGRVRVVEPFGTTKVSALGIEEQRVNVVIDLTSPAPEWERLAHGYQVDVRIVLSAASDVLTVPLTALFRDDEAWAVMVAERGRARLRLVEIGTRNGVAAEIVAGLAVGERVIVHPSDRVQDGVRVAARGL